MKNAIFATIYHCASTDENPQHQKCPKGKDSWCFYQSAKAKNLTPGLHSKNVKTPLNKMVFQQVLPVYKRLSENSLLERCSKSLTQNANESLHSRNWQRCPKTIFVSKERVEMAVVEAICEYNVGIVSTMTLKYGLLGLKVTQAMLKIAYQRDLEREKKVDSKRSKSAKRARQIIKSAQIERERQIRTEEGTTYSAGKF